MNQLTEKQKQNRAYYAKNADKIRAQKRALYSAVKKTHISKPVKAASPKTPDKPRKKISNQLLARRKIEDLLMARELNIDDLGAE